MIRRWPKTWTLVLCTPLTGQNEGLFDLSLEDLLKVQVSGVSRRTEVLDGAPAVVTVVRREEIATFGARTLVDVLERLPGVIPYQGLNPFNYSSVRGNATNTNDRHLLYLIDGLPVRFNAIFGGNQLLNNMLPVESIERIEFIRGQGSSIYGANAVSGILNIVTRKGQANRVEIAGGGGSGSSWSGRAQVSQRWEEGSLFVLADARDHRDWFASFRTMAFTPPSTLTPTLRNGRVENRVRALNLHATWHEFSLGLLTARREGVNLGSLASSPVVEQDSEFLHLQASWRRALSARTDLEIALGYAESETELSSLDSESSTLSLLAFVQHRFSDRSNLLLGVDVDRADGQTLFPTPTAFIPDHDLWRYSFYGQTDYRWSDQVKIGAGLRWTKPEFDSGALVPQAFANWTPAPDWGATLTWGQSFRAPDPRELYSSSMVQMGNPNLEPEAGESINLSLYHSTPTRRLALSYHYTELDDLISNQGGMFQNLGRRRFEGLEFEFRWEPIEHLRLQGNADYLLETDDGLAPDWTVKLGVAVNTDRLGDYGLWATHVGDHQATGTLYPGVQLINPDADAYTLLSLKATYDLDHLFPSESVSSRFEVYLQNMLNEDVWHPVNSSSALLPNTVPGGPGSGLHLQFVIDF